MSFFKTYFLHFICNIFAFCAQHYIGVSNALKEQNVNIVLCGGIGQGAKTALAGFGIHSFGGVTGNADEAVKKYLRGKLEFTTDVTCTKHESGKSHSCGGHCH